MQPWILDDRILRGLGPSAVAAEAELEAMLADVVIGLDLAEDLTGRMVDGLADQLVRWFHRFVVRDSAAREALEEAARWAGVTIMIGDGTPDHRIAIGPSFDDADLFVGADGWRVQVSRRSAQPLGSPGLGAAAAPHIAMLELFKTLFADWVDVEPCDEVHLSLFDWTAEGTGSDRPRRCRPRHGRVGREFQQIAHGGLAALHDLPSVRGHIVSSIPVAPAVPRSGGTRGLRQRGMA